MGAGTPVIYFARTDDKFLEERIMVYTSIQIHLKKFRNF